MKNAPKTCLNPSCRRRFTPGHYGRRQLVCGGTYLETCAKCEGAKCKRCGGKGSRERTCKAWYKTYWQQTRKPPRGIPDDALDRLLVEAKKEDLRLYAFYVTARFSALRKGELLGLTYGDVVGADGRAKKSCDLRGQWDDVEGFKPTKTKKARVAFFMAGARQVIEEIAKRPHKPFERLFPFTEAGVWRWWKLAQARLGIVNPQTQDGYRVHDIRHACIRETADKHGIEMAAEVAGHEDLKTTRIYTVRTAEETVNLLDGAAPTKRKAQSK